mmetsp:Transcript_56269/g.174927  ORF Transcript_56269/g.174927 Transcript_56269/m.174927 type:complete len:85 (+) Transcript_56269:587-841(+)
MIPPNVDPEQSWHVHVSTSRKWLASNKWRHGLSQLGLPKRVATSRATAHAADLGPDIRTLRVLDRQSNSMKAAAAQVTQAWQGP